MTDREFDDSEFEHDGDPTINTPELSQPQDLSQPLEPVTNGPLSSLDDEQRRRVGALNMAKPLLSDKGVLGASKPPDIDDLLRLAKWILDGQFDPLYPFQSGDTLVLGPEIFVAIDGSKISWKGTNYEKQEEDRGER